MQRHQKQGIPFSLMVNIQLLSEEVALSRGQLIVLVYGFIINMLNLKQNQSTFSYSA